MQDGQTVAAAIPTVWAWVIGICGGITAIAAAWAVIRRPYKALEDKIDAQGKEIESLRKLHEADQQSNDKRLAADLELLTEMNGTIKHMHYGMFVLLDHAATGNSVDRCKEARDKLEKHSSGM